ncbi:transglutaminase-like domain-containing protein [Eubacterium oxidoreducens]|uniref:Transglutaminase-like superfamily protein n=1 Tax=Eubacterium oxidoreducens TaxID=1732 RepID=A0A1G6BLE6_EUBOX|nr:transglutaminase-like domain-containing protein [Eubacterium oxidoreducens]SDB21438.1 Transglutaminase-like superfamily protein [Eubacterium oxidoreducens]
MKKLIHKSCMIVLLIIGITVMCSCSENTQPSETSDSSSGGYEVPEFLDAQFSEEEATEYEDGNIEIDETKLSYGYLAMKAEKDNELKLKITHDEESYIYDFENDGTVQFFPLNMGDGEYEVILLEFISEGKYAKSFSIDYDVAMENEFDPYIRPNKVVNYTADSECVQLAKKLATKASDDAQLVSIVYEYLCDHVTYDDEKAATVEAGYLPTPDETLESGKGICFDYAALAASMFRSMGIPCQLITGYVSPSNVYHAWNKVYLESQGWVTVEIAADAKNWNRIDITFAASGVDTENLDDDTLYTQRYTY